MPSPSPLRPALPGYVWDKRLRGGGRYREVLPSGALGKLVSRQRIVEGLRAIHDGTARRLGDLAADAAEGRITAAEFQRAMMIDLKNLYNGSSALARGGWSQMDPASWGRNGQILRGEYGFLAGFAQELADGKLSPAQARARAAMYVGKAYSRFWAEDNALKKASGEFTEERWNDSGDQRECHDCAVLGKRNWVLIGSLGTVPGAGDTACGGACRCDIEYR